MEMDGTEIELLRPFIDNEIELESEGFKGSDEELFYEAISEIGVSKIRSMVFEYNKCVGNIQHQITALERKIWLFESCTYR